MPSLRTALLGCLLLLPALRAQAACMPVSAQVIGTADDAEDIYVNGTLVATFGFVNAGSPAPTPVAIPVGLFTQTGNVIAAVVRNTAPSAVLGSFAITLVCADGTRSYITSDDFPNVYFDDSNTAPPPNNGGFNWTQPGWTDAGALFTGVPVQVTAWTWNKPTYNPKTGALLRQLGRNAAGSSFGGSDRIYFRGLFDLDSIPYNPPAFTITKTASGGNVGSMGVVAYTVTVCNSGAPTVDPVIVRDVPPHWGGSAGYMSSPSSFNGPPSDPVTSSGSDPILFTFADGFAGNGACVTLHYSITMPWFDATACTMVNSAEVVYAGVAQDSDSATVNTTNACAASTPTRSVTPTATRSPTRSATATATPSPSRSATASQTLSATPTATSSQTPTASPIASATDTPTATATRSQTPTATPSASVSGTPTTSATRSQTPTATGTSTDGPTPTSSATPSVTPSFSATATVTPSRSATATPSATPTATDSFTASPSATESAVYSPTSTPTASPTPSASQTFSATASASATPTSSPTMTPSGTGSMTPSRTASATPSESFSATPTRTETPSATASATLSPSFSVTPTFSVSPTVSPTPVPVPFQLTAQVYNAAGELVKTLYQGACTRLPVSLQPDKGSFVGGQDRVGLPLDGSLADGSGELWWDGSNAGGQWVTAGVYTLKLEAVDSFGHVVSLDASVTVLPAASEAWLRLSNAAGELVWQARLPVEASGFSLDSQTLGLAGEGQAGSGLSVIKITLDEPRGTNPQLQWDGRNSQGRLVDSGVYDLVLSSTQPGAGTQVQAAKITVIRGPDGDLLGDAVLGPNPLQGQDWAELRYTPWSGLAAWADVYSLAGERVAGGGDPSLSGRIRLDLGALSSGVYVYVVRQGGQRKVLKLAIVR